MKTQLYIRKDLLNRLRIIAKDHDLTITMVIKILLKRFENCMTRTDFSKSQVKYQEKDSNTKWTRFHLTLTPGEYETFTDLRKFCKLSVSNIVAISAKKYLKQLFNDDVMHNCTSSPFPVHIITAKIHAKGITVIIQHGIPTPSVLYDTA